MHSALYIGRLRHRRHAPRRHAFSYALCMVWLDLAELDEVFRRRWFWSTRRPALAWLKRADYLGDPGVPLEKAVRDAVAAHTGQRPTGPVRMLTQLRSFGHCFNPVTFYYCFAPDGTRIETILAQITNTPWGERHTYVLPVERAEGPTALHRFHLDKRFHVSPFMQMAQRYHWTFTAPAARLAVHMDNLQQGERVFDATLVLRRREIGTASLALALLRWPAATLRVQAAIYWQALRLWLKRVPFHTHPGGRAASG
ncbi:MAG TPA: DUF1365 domain-containing protein [Steroidobacteraceae bacterium]|nr:DUF1365 domain-containing protein [Steroidobacteraceae bacterium]